MTVTRVFIFYLEILFEIYSLKSMTNKHGFSMDGSNPRCRFQLLKSDPVNTSISRAYNDRNNVCCTLTGFT